MDTIGEPLDREEESADSREMFQHLLFPFQGGQFPDNLGAVVQQTVLSGEWPALVVVHTPDGSWLIGDGVNDPNLPGAAAATHIGHAVKWNSSIAELATMEPGHIAQRSVPGEPWQITSLEGWDEEPAQPSADLLQRVSGTPTGDEGRLSEEEADPSESKQECAMCGRPVEVHDRHVRFVLPDPVLDSPHQGRVNGAWLSHGDANSSVMMQIPDFGAFVRALLPVHLTGGYTVTFGVWVGVHPDELQRVSDIWFEPAYQDLKLSGRLANAIGPWGLLATPVELAVVNPAETPYCVASSDPMLAKVLSTQWPHEDLLASLP